VKRDQRVPECTTQEWVVAGKRNSCVSYYQTDCSAVAAVSDVGCKLAACQTMSIAGEV